MSITNSLYIGISGLQAHGDAISVVGDNIANASTVGYKRSRAEFSDMLGGALGSQRMGGGVRLGGTESLFDQGAIQQTGAPLDMAIRGKGFFQVSGSHDGQNGSFYTRNGTFSLDNKGYVVNPQGLRLQGYTITAGQRSAAVGDLDLGATTSPPVATTKASMTMNLDASLAPTKTFDPTNPTATSDYQTSQTVYDSLGGAHQAQMFFTKTAAGWDYNAMVDGGDVTGGTKGVPTLIANGNLTFDAMGKMTAQTVGSSSVSFTGAQAGQAIDFSFGDPVAGTGSTSYVGPSTTTATSTDGHGAGSLTDIVIASDGKVQGVYDNGDRIDIAQVALADFSNDQGLQRSGDSLYSATDASGQALVGAVGTGGRGAISSGALEGSNVDLGSELVTLIAYQRAFQANAKTVTTADEMMTDVTNLKR